MKREQIKELAEKFRYNWMKENPNTIHIPSEHEIDLMTDFHLSQLQEVSDRYEINELLHGNGNKYSISLKETGDVLCETETLSNALIILSSVSKSADNKLVEALENANELLEHLRDTGRISNVDTLADIDLTIQENQQALTEAKEQKGE